MHGQPAEHAKAKEILAGVMGVFVGCEVETKGLDSNLGTRGRALFVAHTPTRSIPAFLAPARKPSEFRPRSFFPG
ncbi:Uncharacterized protein TPAR_02426 [Tolypocladium paradoxum]|uniref:Uncharacterized protein n=1 Tax=Tolypocladium paradoxum TaxID=94208 RepID=A0A2S4L4M5_9HYPO|nr:Uncharacterized protein TPAR_02426 [Tolypocladium paradoxum]